MILVLLKENRVRLDAEDDRLPSANQMKFKLEFLLFVATLRESEIEKKLRRCDSLPINRNPMRPARKCDYTFAHLAK